MLRNDDVNCCADQGWRSQVDDPVEDRRDRSENDRAAMLVCITPEAGEWVWFFCHNFFFTMLRIARLLLKDYDTI